MKKIFALCAVLFFSLSTMTYSAESLTCWFAPGWKKKAPQAKAIAKALSENSGLTIKPRIAKSYPQVLTSFSSDEKNIVYVGSFVQAIINARGIGTPLVQNINGKELYCGVMVYPKGEDPETILKNNPAEIAFAKGASSGESSAKAATGGQAAIATKNHGASCAAVKAGKAKAGVVKNWWWEANKQKFPNLAMYEMPGVSIKMNPDNVLTASNSISVETREKITAAAVASKDAFGAPKMMPFNPATLQFSLDLMKRGKIDPLTYTW